MLSKQQLANSPFFLFFVAGLAALAPFAVDGYLPTLPDMASSMNATMAAANLTVSAFMFGMAIGQFVGGPLSDQLGRKAIGLTGLILFATSSLLIIFAQSIEAIQLLRVSQAIGGGFASVVCMAQARDVFAPEVVAKKFANIILVILIAPMIAPTIGALVASSGWRTVFWLLLGYSTMMIALYVTLIPETNEQRSGRFNLAQMLRGYAAAISQRTNGRLIAIRFAMFSGLSSGILFCYVTNAAFIYIEYFSLSTFEFAAVFGLMAFMLMVGNRITAKLLDTHAAPQILNWANLVQIVMAIAIVVLGSLSDVKLWQVLICLGGLIICNGMISPAASGYFISLYDENIGSASSLNASMMFAFGSIVGGVAAIISNEQLLPIFVIMLVCAICARITLVSTR